MADASPAAARSGEERGVDTDAGNASDANATQPATPNPPALSRESTSKMVLSDTEESVKSFTRSPTKDKLRRIFDTFDIDKNGLISHEEITTMVNTLRIDIPMEVVDTLFNEADTSGDGEIDFDEFLQATEKSSFIDLVTAASFPSEVAKILEEGNLHFLASFKDLCSEMVSACQTEVLAANVPMASFGRVHTALTTLKAQLTGQAHELLAAEFTQLRTGALESLHAQRVDIEKRDRTVLQMTIEEDKSREAKQVAAAVARQKAAEAEVERLTARYGQPEITISSLEKQLAAALQRSANLEAQLKTIEDDWNDGFPRALAMCSATPPPLPADTPFITRALEQRGYTLRAFLESLTTEGSAPPSVSKVELRKMLQKLNIADEHARQPDAWQAELDARPAPEISVDELSALLLEWKGPPSRQAATKGQKERPPPDGALGRALDRTYAAEAHGSRTAHVVELYERLLVAREEKHAHDTKLLKDRLASEGSNANAALHEQAEAWEAERARLVAQVRQLEGAIEAEKAVRQEEVTKAREAAELAAAKDAKTQKEDAAELRSKLRAKEAELEQSAERLRSTTAELQAATRDKERKTVEVKQSRQEQEEGIAAVKAKLMQTLAALKKAEAAQPGQGGYYFAAAPTKSVLTSPSSSRQGSPERHGMRPESSRTSPVNLSPGREGGHGPYYSGAEDLVEKARRIHQLSSSPPPRSPPARSPPGTSKRSGGRKPLGSTSRKAVSDRPKQSRRRMTV